MTERDPRVNPKPGDVLRDGVHRISVTTVDRQIRYTLTRSNGYGINAIPMHCHMAKKSWREWAKNAEVIDAAG